MSQKASNKVLTSALDEVCKMYWSDFVMMERNTEMTYAQSVIVSLVRQCVKKRPNIFVIKEAIDRLCNRPEEVIEIKVPKQYIVYPYAEDKASGGEIEPEVVDSRVADLDDVYPVSDLDLIVPTSNLRGVLKTFITKPRGWGQLVMEMKEKCEKEQMPTDQTPTVGVVIVASLLEAASEGNTLALIEVFDQIDGKLAKVLNVNGGGSNVFYLNNYSKTAPANAIKGDDGVYYVEKPMLVRGITPIEQLEGEK